VTASQVIGCPVQTLERPFLSVYHRDMKKSALAYVRVSTQKQGASGFGLEAQRAAVEQFCREQGLELVAEYQEIESGRHNACPVLAKALAHAKRSKAVLVIARLDRLARNVHFISGLMESGAEFRAVDIPAANRLLLHIMSAVAEAEASAISSRTKAALQAAKDRGTLLGAANVGSRNLTDAARRTGAAAAGAVVHAKAVEFYSDVMPVVAALKAEGRSMREIAAALTEQGFPTRHGAAWNHVQVKRLLDRAA